MEGWMSFPVVMGALCRLARDLEYFMKTVLATEPWWTRQEIVPLPWREVELPEKMTIGVFADDGVVKPHPPVTITIEKFTKLLGSQVDIVVKGFKPFDHARGYDIVRRLHFQDGGAENFGLMEQAGEPVLPLSEWVMQESHTKKKNDRGALGSEC
jgi:hypothetical protein